MTAAMKSHRRICFLLLFLIVAGFVTAAQEPKISLPDLAGRSVNPFAPFGDDSIKAVVFIFLRTDCPISNRYAPEIQRLQREFASRQIRFYLIYPTADETVAAIEKHLTDYGYERGQILRDPRHELVKLTGATVTPEAVVFVRNPNGFQAIYRGRIDDRVVAFGKQRPQANERDLEKVLLAAGKKEAVKFTERAAIGCYISKLNEP